MPNGLTYWGFTAGGDWEFSIYFILYFDGKHLRGYIPKEGNVWNYKTNAAFGNGEDEDGDPDEPDFDFEPDKIVADIENRIIARANKPKVNKLAKFSDAEILAEVKLRRLDI